MRGRCLKKIAVANDFVKCGEAFRQRIENCAFLIAKSSFWFSPNEGLARPKPDPQSFTTRISSGNGPSALRRPAGASLETACRRPKEAPALEPFAATGDIAAVHSSSAYRAGPPIRDALPSGQPPLPGGPIPGRPAIPVRRDSPAIPRSRRRCCRRCGRRCRCRSSRSSRGGSYPSCGPRPRRRRTGRGWGCPQCRAPGRRC